MLCYPDDLYPDMDITVHEFGHSLHWVGFAQLWPEFQVRTEKIFFVLKIFSHFQVDLDACYANAYANSLWGWGYVGGYAMTNSGMIEDGGHENVPQ